MKPESGFFFGISDVADDLVRGALVEMKADIIESV